MVFDKIVFYVFTQNIFNVLVWPKTSYSREKNIGGPLNAKLFSSFKLYIIWVAIQNISYEPL